LEGLRVPVANLFQVVRVEFATEPTFPNPIFFDDPTLIGLLADGFDPTKWQTEVLAGTRIRVVYSNGTNREWSVADVATLNMQSWSHQSGGGIWVVPTLRWTVPRSVTNLAAGECAAEESEAASSADPWVAWATNRTPQLTVEHRGRSVSIPVPIFTTLTGIDAVSRSGELVVMNGMDQVWHRPNGQNEFLGMVKLTATYSQNFDSSVTATREDVIADIDAGICRSVIWTTVYVPKVDYDPMTIATGSLNTLFDSLNSARFINDGREQRITVTMSARNAAGTEVRTRTDRVQIGLVAYP
jgi:hypothetical protein